MPLPPRHILSKSTFLRGWQCPKRLWLNKKRRDLIPQISAGQEMLFEKGTDVGLLARELFPGGKDAAPVDHFQYPESVQQTAVWVQSGEGIIYEAAFQYDRVLAALDILVKKKNSYYAYEVKSSTEVKEYHVRDAALQYYVMTHSGLALQDIFIIHINNVYTRKKELELDKLFTIVSVKKEVLALQEEIAAQVTENKAVLQRAAEPSTDIGPHCTDPFPCEFMDHCWSHIPDVSVFDLTRLRGDKKFELYYEGIMEFHQLPEGYALTTSQQLQVRAYLEDYTHIEPGRIQKWLKQLKYPLYFMDFETFNPAVPLYSPAKPFQQIPFQFSVHIQEKPDVEIRHVEYLGSPQQDPRPEFARQLIKAVKEKGSILVYSSFEATQLKQLKEDFPEFKTGIGTMLNRLVDLMEPFQKKWYYTPGMNGSYSIKDVLPALVPEMNYDHLEIGEGATAMAAFEGLLKITDKNHIDTIRNALLKYCEMDTLAMVRILEKLKRV